MNESEFRRLVREAIGEPPPSPSGDQLHAFLIHRGERRRQRMIAAAAFGLAALVVVVLFGSYRLLGVTQRTTPAAPLPAVPTAVPTRAAPSAAPTATPVPAASTPRFASFPLPGSASFPVAATVGPDGAVWYADDGNPVRIVRVSVVGQTTGYPLPGDQFAPPNFVTAGPDGALWFTRGGKAGVIGRLGVTGQYSEYPLPAQGTGPAGIAAGPDGALWFTEASGNKIGRITPSGQVREYALPSATSVQCGQLCPTDITVGPDGALWFVNTQLGGVPGIGRITTSGAVSLYHLPVGSVPSAITLGPDGNLWFSEYRGPGLGRITPTGQVTEYTVPGFPQTAASVGGITGGPDGAVWFTIAPGVRDADPFAATRPGQLGRVAPDGSVTLYTPSGEGVTGPIVLGSDGSLWAFGRQTFTRITVS